MHHRRANHVYKSVGTTFYQKKKKKKEKEKEKKLEKGLQYKSTLAFMQRWHCAWTLVSSVMEDSSEGDTELPVFEIKR